MNNKIIKFRVAKITPTKIGQFVTFWKRSRSGKIIPYDLLDPFNFLIVSVSKNEHFGQFIFPKSVLYDKGILSKNGHGGKHALRVYPPWDTTESKQAKKTQSWQTKYFLNIDANKDSKNTIQELKILFVAQP